MCADLDRPLSPRLPLSRGLPWSAGSSAGGTAATLGFFGRFPTVVYPSSGAQPDEDRVDRAGRQPTRFHDLEAIQLVVGSLIKERSEDGRVRIAVGASQLGN